MANTYTSYIADIQTLIAMDPLDADWNEIIPTMITYAELRIYRDLDLISTVTRDTSVSCTFQNPNVQANNSFVVIQGINVLTPPGNPILTSARNPLAQVSKEVIYGCFGDPNYNNTPIMYCMVDQWNFLIGPSPDNTYILEIYGTQRPLPLSATNTTTFLTTWLYDLFVAASMVFMSGYQRNFAMTGNDPAMPINWEQQYKTLLAAASLEELKKKSQGDAWTSYSPTPAQPPRG